MQIHMMKSKIHRATVTDGNLDYEGSISIDLELCKAAGILINEKVDIYNCNNGERFSTYVIAGEKGDICLNGPAALLVEKGDKIVIVSYAIASEEEARTHEPVVVKVNDQNKILSD